MPSGWNILIAVTGGKLTATADTETVRRLCLRQAPAGLADKRWRCLIACIVYEPELRTGFRTAT